MTPPSVPKVCRECYHYRLFKKVEGWFNLGCDSTTHPCAALELLQTVSAQSPSDCRSEEMCLLAERLRKEVR